MKIKICKECFTVNELEAVKCSKCESEDLIEIEPAKEGAVEEVVEENAKVDDSSENKLISKLKNILSGVNQSNFEDDEKVEVERKGEIIEDDDLQSIVNKQQAVIEQLMSQADEYKRVLDEEKLMNIIKDKLAKAELSNDHAVLIKSLVNKNDDENVNEVIDTYIEIQINQRNSIINNEEVPKTNTNIKTGGTYDEFKERMKKTAVDGNGINDFLSKFKI